MLPKLKFCKTETICLQTDQHLTLLFQKATNIYQNRHIFTLTKQNASDNSVIDLFIYGYSHFRNIFDFCRVALQKRQRRVEIVEKTLFRAIRILSFLLQIAP